MPRPSRAAEGGLIYHALNRAVARLTLFDTDDDYETFEQVLAEAVARYDMRLLAYCIMPDHFHILLWPREDGDLSSFMRWMTMSHAQRWHAQHQTAGSGHLYQGRYRSFPVQADEHLLTICRFVEQNGLRAGLVDRAEEWRWSSLWSRRAKDAKDRPALTRWPIDRPSNWTARVNRPFDPEEEEAVRRSIQRGQPFGAAPWQAKVAARLGLESSLRPRGRPRKNVARS
jgi:putative transposase